MCGMAVNVEKIVEKPNKIFMLSKNDTDLYFIDSDIVRFFGDNIGILSVDPNNIRLDHDNFNKNEPKSIICVMYTV